MKPIRLLVCGGRDFADRRLIRSQLDRFHEGGMIGVLINGGARGVDSIAAKWADDNWVACETYEADWKGQGRAAGPIRNQRMLDEGKPDEVWAWPGGRGTADMVRRAKAAGVPVLEVQEI
jgi:hypothetical protein